MLAAKLSVEMPNIERDRAEGLVAQAHQCPYSKAIRGNVKVEVTVT